MATQVRRLATLALATSALGAVGLGSLAADQHALKRRVSLLEGRVETVEDTMLTESRPVDMVSSDG